MTSQGVVVRPPGPDEAEAVARCQLDCWRDAYAGLVDPVRLAPLLDDVDGRIARWVAILAGPSLIRVADDDGRLVGLAAVIPAEGEGPVRLGALYTLRAYWRTGLGQRLLDASLGDAPATLLVLRDNDRARWFYARNGFVPDGTEQQEPHFGGVEIGMVRPAPAG